MKTFLLVIAMIVVGIVALIFWERWDEKKNRGYTWGYWGEFNTISNTLTRLPGVTVVDAWCNNDFLVLEEMAFDLVFRGETVVITFGEKDPVRKLGGRPLEKALLDMLEKKLSKNRLLKTP